MTPTLQSSDDTQFVIRECQLRWVCGGCILSQQIQLEIRSFYYPIEPQALSQGKYLHESPSLINVELKI